MAAAKDGATPPEISAVFSAAGIAAAKSGVPESVIGAVIAGAGTVAFNAGIPSSQIGAIITGAISIAQGQLGEMGPLGVAQAIAQAAANVCSCTVGVPGYSYGDLAPGWSGPANGYGQFATPNGGLGFGGFLVTRHLRQGVMAAVVMVAADRRLRDRFPGVCLIRNIAEQEPEDRAVAEEVTPAAAARMAAAQAVRAETVQAAPEPRLAPGPVAAA